MKKTDFYFVKFDDGTVVRVKSKGKKGVFTTQEAQIFAEKVYKKQVEKIWKSN